MSIRIAIAEDHPMTARGIKDAITCYADMEVTGSYNSGATLMDGLKQTVPDVLLLDIHLPDQTGDQLAPLVKKLYPDVRILVLTNFDSPLYVNKMVGHSVMGYLLKTATEELLITAIRTVYEGKEFLEPGMQEKINHLSLRKNRAISQKVILTPKEKEILQLIVDGVNSPDIASRLFLSQYTVNNYRNNILLKMDVKNMAELTKKALLLGMVE